MTRSSLLLGSSFVLLSACMMREPAPMGTSPDYVDGELEPAESPAKTKNEAKPTDAPAPVTTATTEAARQEGGERDLADESQASPRPYGSVAAKDDALGDARSRESRRQVPMEESVAQPAYGPSTGAVGGAIANRALSVAPPPPPAEPVSMYGNSEGYTDYGVNPFTMVADDAQSTFSIDVDTASFSLARRKIESGVLPPPEAVRVEEFVNYADWGYRAPTDGSAFAVHMAAMPDPFRQGRHILRVGVKAKEVARDARPPVHLTFLVDVSGSMSSEDKLGLAQQSMHLLVDGLREEDTVALATYAGRTARILEPTPASNKRAIHDAISALQSGGSTAMSAGIDIAYDMARESFAPGHENRVVILSDGDANVGNTSWDDMLSQIKADADRGITLSTIGFGMGNYQDTLMEQLSNKGDGNNFYIDDAVQAQRVFVDELGGTMVTVARDAKIQVEFDEQSVLAYRLIGYENRDIADRDFRNDKVDAGEVGAGHDVTAVYELILKDGYRQDVATVRMRWEQPGADVDQGGSGATEKAWTFKDRDIAERADLAERNLRMAYASATFAEVLRQSSQVSELSMDALLAFARASKRSGEADDVELIGLMEKARALGAGTPTRAVSAR